ncbi:MAG: hypothetical protein GY856_12785 [bacterium]|nr:hypothetical protein [bacterium]
MWDLTYALAEEIVLYLAAHEPEERGRDQILADLDIEMTDQDLEQRLHKLVKADILADGSSNFHYRGLGGGFPAAPLVGGAAAGCRWP